MLDDGFLAEFKRATEAKWAQATVDPSIYGFQIHPGTRWNPGLPDVAISEFESALNVQFPHDFRCFLRAMNGTDLPTINVYGNCGEPIRHSIGVFAYPKDLTLVKERMRRVDAERNELIITMKQQGFELSPDASLVPIYAHRYLVCTPNPDRSAVLSIESGDDAIVYGNSLRDYLEDGFL